MKKKIIFSLYYVSVAKNGVFVHKHLKADFWKTKKQKIHPKDSHFQLGIHTWILKIIFYIGDVKAKKKKYLKNFQTPKKKKISREFFFLSCTKKIQWEKRVMKIKIN